MSKRQNPRAEQLRKALAQEAARIMSEQGIDDYGLAKRKAAERLGASDIAVLPKNTEIEAALAAHQRMFEAHTHTSELSGLRRTALQAMRLLKRFDPRLVGPVLSGTASAHSEVNLHLFAEGAERATSRTGWSHTLSFDLWRGINRSTQSYFRSTAFVSRRQVRSTAARCAGPT